MKKLLFMFVTLSLVFACSDDFYTPWQPKTFTAPLGKWYEVDPGEQQRVRMRQKVGEYTIYLSQKMELMGVSTEKYQLNTFVWVYRGTKVYTLEHRAYDYVEGCDEMERILDKQYRKAKPVFKKVLQKLETFNDCIPEVVKGGE